MYADSDPLTEKEEHFVYANKCRKRITWEAVDVRKIINRPKGYKYHIMHALGFEVGNSLGTPFRGTLSMEEIKREEHCLYYIKKAEERMFCPMVGFARISEIAKASLSLEIFSGNQKIWNGKTDSGQEAVFPNSTKELHFELIPYQIFASAIENNDAIVTIILELEVWMCHERYVAAPNPKKVQNGERLTPDVSQILLETGAGSDFVIKVPSSNNCGYFSRKVHKAVLAVASPVFWAMVYSENDTLEGKENYTVIEDLSEKGLNILLEYLYTGIISSDWIQVSLEILNAAEKYELQKLKEYCRKNLQTSFKEVKPFDIAQLAELSRSPNPKKKLENLVSKTVDDIINTFKLDAQIK